MRILSYARVSTIRQEGEGESLVNQERAFQGWLKRNPNAVRLRAYAESKSAKSIEGREQFSRMIAELPTLKPDLVLVDTIDRFTRNLEDGLALLKQFKGHGVKLLPLEWDEPIDLDDDRDWKGVVQEMTAAEMERRRIRTRINRSFAGRRERGATLHNRAPLGLSKQKDRLVPDPDIVEVIKEIDRRYIEGESKQTILEYVQAVVGERAWKTLNGVNECLKNPEYVKAGVRSIETQRRIDARREVAKNRFGQERTFVHPMSGVFACGVCVETGHPVERALMKASCAPASMRSWSKGSPGARIICEGHQHKRHEGNIGVQEFALELIFGELLKSLKADASLLEAWEAQQRQAQDSSQERLLQKRLDAIEAKEKKLPLRREQVFELLSDSEPPVRNQAKKMLAQLDTEEAALAADKEAVLLHLSSAAAPPALESTAQGLQAMLAKAAQSWPKFSNERKNEVGRAFCNAVGSYPRVYKGKAVHPVETAVSWPEVLPNVLYRVLYGKGIVPRVETLTTIPRRKKAREVAENVTLLRKAK